MNIISLIISIQTLGIVAAAHAIMKSRTSQGAIAWTIALITFPYLSLPLYLIFGRNKFQGYVKARRSGDLAINHIAKRLSAKQPEGGLPLSSKERTFDVLQQLAKMPFTSGNDVKLLINGDETFKAIFSAIAKAQHYVVVQYYIVHNDEVGVQLQQALVDKARQGVKIYFLYDEIGSHKLTDAYLSELSHHGVEVSPFLASRGWLNRLQMNFRNHRKIVIVDGNVAFMGGLNVGDEYLGRSIRFGFWRDTHCQVQGAAVQCIQLSFIEDWYWATKRVAELYWEIAPVEDSEGKVLIFPTSPADQLETCSLMFVHAIHSAKQRLWISSPYFVPDTQVVNALQLAALRGVDVRILIPDKADSLLVKLASFPFIKQCHVAGVGFYYYEKGFLHQKVMLIDDNVATVGTANLDNRSFRLNFEVTLLSSTQHFVQGVRDMLKQDFENSRRVSVKEIIKRPLFKCFASRVACLLAPIL